MSSHEFDVLVIGAGPGGYVAAIRAAQLGLRTALVEKRNTLGGTCLNVGCIPSKALLHLSEQYAFARHHAGASGIVYDNVRLDLAALMAKKDAVVGNLVKGVGQLVKARKITTLHGRGKLIDPHTVEVIPSKGEASRHTAASIILATGSVPIELSDLPCDGQTVITSDEAIRLETVPGQLVVVGGGAIGLEMGSVWSRLGSEVTVVEFLPEIANGFDTDLSRTLARELKKQGLKIETNARVTGFQKGKGKSKGTLIAEKQGKELSFPADVVLVSVGRRPFHEGLGLDAVGVALDERKRIKVNDHWQTSVPSIYAIGDLIGGPMLAHKGEEEGVALAEHLAGKPGHVNYDVIPNVIYTDPEVATVGLSESQAKEKGLSVQVGKFPFSANGRALASDATAGFVKVIADEKTDRILGVGIMGRNASELIAEAVTHMEYGGSAEDLGRTVHAHPTLSEAVKEAGLAVSHQAIHAL